LLIDGDDAPAASGGPTPEATAEQAQRLALAEAVLAGMSDKARRAFVLFEVEGYSGEEIAQLEGIPLATVWTRVHHARKEFAARREKLERRGTR
jgi:RNA polymerase sigma-70 factor (ECF subfamily)